MDSLKWFVDPSHAWLRVPKALVNALGIRDKISPFSYEDDEHLYLEEDCDAYHFIEAAKAKDRAEFERAYDKALANEDYTNGESMVRGLSHVG